MKIELLRQTIELEKCELLREFTVFDKEEWSLVRHTPEWKVEPDLIRGGSSDEKTHGQIFCRTPFTGDVILEFEARIVPPSYHDIVWFWNTKLIDEEPCWSGGYLGCLAGWWSNMAGIEKLPAYDPSAIAPSHDTKSGVWYHIVSGSSGDEHFICVNGKLVTYVADSHPADITTPSHIGFGIYESNCEYRKLKVWRPKSVPRSPKYLPGSEFRCF